MSAGKREATFQLCGAGLALAIALGGILLGEALPAPWGRYALFVSLPAGVAFGWTVIKLLQFAYREVIEES